MQKHTKYMHIVMWTLILLVIQIYDVKPGFSQSVENITEGISSNDSSPLNSEIQANITESSEPPGSELTNPPAPTNNQTDYKEEHYIPLAVYTGTITDIDPPFSDEISGSYDFEKLPENGTLTGNYPNFKYRSNSDFAGPDEFVIQKLNLSNARDLLESATFQVSVHERNPPGSTINQADYKEHHIPLNIYTDTITGINLPFSEIIGSYDTDLPENGTLTVNYPENANATQEHPKFMYQSKSNFSGPDQFLIQKLDLSNSSKLLESATFQVSVHERSPSVPLFWDEEPIARSIAALAASAVVTVLVFIGFWRIVKRYKGKTFKGKTFKIYFSDIIRTSDWDPSLSTFQFLMWTAVILFSFLGLYLVRIFSGVTDFVAGGIPASVLGLMGISVALPLLSQYITKSKKGPGTLTDNPPPEPRPPLSLMLYENNQPSLSRFQLFAWTWISIIIYISVLFSQINTHMDTTHNLLLPDIDPTLLLLMGLSNFAYLGVKAQNSKMQITSMFPEEEIDVSNNEIQELRNRIILPSVGKINIGRQRIGETLSIFGTNFAHQRDKIWFDDTPYPIEGSDIKNEITWQPTGDRIDVKIPDNLKPHEPHEHDSNGHIYLVRVANNGFLSDPFPLRILPKTE